MEIKVLSRCLELKVKRNFLLLENQKIVAITVVFQVIFAIIGGRNAFLSYLRASESPERCAIASGIPKNPMLNIKKVPNRLKKWNLCKNV